MIEILHSFTGAVLYTSATADDIAGAVLEARKNREDLRGAYLNGADLSGAYLSGADLSGANLRGAIGLLPRGIVPLQILGSRHLIIVRMAGFIAIGCIHKPLDWWRANCAATGEKNAYSPEQIAEYAAHIDYCAAWMKTNCLDQPEAPAKERKTA